MRERACASADKVVETHLVMLMLGTFLVQMVQAGVTEQIQRGSSRK